VVYSLGRVDYQVLLAQRERLDPQNTNLLLTSTKGWHWLEKTRAAACGNQSGPGTSLSSG
jgi:hypothetical protein